MTKPPLAITHPGLSDEWHPTLNDDLTPHGVTSGSARRVWWIDDLGHEWAAQVNNRAHGTGCPYCANISVLAGYNDLASTRPDVAAQWHPTRNGDLHAAQVARTSNKKRWWLCPLGHEWESTVGNRTTLGQGCPVCSNQQVLAGFNDLATRNPLVAAEWHPTRNAPLTPLTVLPSTARKVWWQDALGHEWQASLNARSNGANCPFCSGQRILVGFNDLGTRQPAIAAEWHPTRNGDRTPQMVTAMNGKHAWWLCQNQHEWSAVVSSRSLGTGCPACAGMTVIAGVNDLASRHPEVAASWHPTRNGTLTPATVAVYSNRKAWFRCSAGHEWESTVNNRTHGQGCPECSEAGGFNPGRPGYVYFLEHVHHAAFKIGITNVGTNRLAAFQTRGWQVLALELFASGADAAAVERAIKQWWRLELRLPVWLSRAEMRQTGGWSETVASAEIAGDACVARIRMEKLKVLDRHWRVV